MWWTVELAERSNKIDGEHFGTSVPFMWMNDIKEDDNLPFDDVPKDSLKVWKDILPLAAIDGHTRIGLHALRLTFSKFGHPLAEKDKARTILFVQEGWLQNDRLKFKAFDYGAMVPRLIHMPYLQDEDFQAHWTRVFIPRLNECRNYLARTHYATVFDALYNEYHRDFIPIAKAT